MVHTNLRLCFPERTEAEIESLCAPDLPQCLPQLCRARHLLDRQREADAPMRGSRSTTRPISLALDGTPHILVTLHLSGVEAGAIRLTIHLREHVEAPGASLYTRQKNELFDGFLKHARGRFGAKMIARNDSRATSSAACAKARPCN
ncbi:LpxL/LpxP family acyltransferase [Cupriavidus basilensis]